MTTSHPTRRAVLAGLAGAVSLARKSPEGAQHKPNLLFILADDHAGSVPGGRRKQKGEDTESRPARFRGARFAANDCNPPVCRPSRQCMFTGQMPHSATMLARSRATPPDAHQEPERLAMADAIDWYLRPRDAQPSPGGTFVFGDPRGLQR